MGRLANGRLRQTQLGRRAFVRRVGVFARHKRLKRVELGVLALSGELLAHAVHDDLQKLDGPRPVEDSLRRQVVRRLEAKFRFPGVDIERQQSPAATALPGMGLVALIGQKVCSDANKNDRNRPRDGVACSRPRFSMRRAKNPCVTSSAFSRATPFRRKKTLSGYQYRWPRNARASRPAESSVRPARITTLQCVYKKSLDGIFTMVSWRSGPMKCPADEVANGLATPQHDKHKTIVVLVVFPPVYSVLCVVNRICHEVLGLMVNENEPWGRLSGLRTLPFASVRG